ncbi:YlmC/YmxH family sporulation protein [uncultured Pseudoflavonifractor sp.]|uniref:YlmC/YmxH family sporulation protein n=1 Tax=uncultured Pseudoflavonifractor sp. TaxID=1221379 RepID=UPI0025F89154|nr:YlmC/YmxH family sporulation protein [uncultured Pseudoflavonifractor sp.]
MKSRIADLRCKEIINVTNGCRYGYVGDVEVELDSGQICALVVPGRLRLFGLLGREEDRIFPWESVRRFGEDIILVESGALEPGRQERRRGRERERKEKNL